MIVEVAPRWRYLMNQRGVGKRRSNYTLSRRRVA
jgi:hypothetical protein